MKIKTCTLHPIRFTSHCITFGSANPDTKKLQKKLEKPPNCLTLALDYIKTFWEIAKMSHQQKDRIAITILGLDEDESSNWAVWGEIKKIHKGATLLVQSAQWQPLCRFKLTALPSAILEFLKELDDIKKEAAEEQEELTREDLLKELAEKGLEGVKITDHTPS